MDTLLKSLVYSSFYKSDFYRSSVIKIIKALFGNNIWYLRWRKYGSIFKKKHFWIHKSNFMIYVFAV